MNTPTPPTKPVPPAVPGVKMSSPKTGEENKQASPENSSQTKPAKTESKTVKESTTAAPVKTAENIGLDGKNLGSADYKEIASEPNVVPSKSSSINQKLNVGFGIIAICLFITISVLIVRFWRKKRQSRTVIDYRLDDQHQVVDMIASPGNTEYSLPPKIKQDKKVKSNFEIRV
jgi:outer membrane biosynthesis protein TonB